MFDNILQKYFTGNGTQWNSTATRVAGNGLQGTANNRLKNPQCVYVDVNYTVYVCDNTNNRIQMWLKGASTGSTVAGGSSGTGANQLNGPLGLTFDNNGYMYVADAGNNRVQKYAPGSTTGSTVAGSNTGTSGTTNSLLSSPTNVIVDNSGNIYVTDYTNRRVMKFPSGSTSGSSGTNIFGGVLAGTTYGIAFQDSLQTNVFVSLDAVPSIQLRTLGLSSINATVATSTSYTTPQGLAVDTYGNVYVVDSGLNQVLMFCAGSWIRRVLIQGSSASLTLAGGIALDSDMNIYVTSTTSDGVYKFSYL